MPENKDDLERRIQGDIQREILLTTTDGTARPYSLIFFDVDHFKAFNDLYSYKQGDEVLNGIRYLLKRMHDQQHFVGIYGNYGGDEFLIALPATSIDDAAIVAEKLQNAAKSHQFEDVDTHEIFKKVVSLSLGLSVVDLQKYFGTQALNEASQKAFDTLLKQSNVALDYGKVLGGGMVQKFHAFLDEEWKRVKQFRQIYFIAPFKDDVQQRLSTTNLSADFSNHLIQDFIYLGRRLAPHDTRILASFADKAYHKHILSFEGDKDTLILNLHRLVCL